MNYVTYLKVKGNFPPKARDLRHNSITFDDCEDFIHDTNITRMLEYTGDTPSNHPPGLTGS